MEMPRCYSPQRPLAFGPLPQTCAIPRSFLLLHCNNTSSSSCTQSELSLTLSFDLGQVINLHKCLSSFNSVPPEQQRLQKEKNRSIFI